MFVRKLCVVGVAVATLGMIGLAIPAQAAPRQAAPGQGVLAAASSGDVAIAGRLYGSDRYGTAVAVAKAAYPTTAPVVFIASGQSFPDALSAGPAAVHEGGPLLLTEPNNLPSEVADEITSLNPSKIIIVGGTGAVSSSVESALDDLVPTVTRIGGVDRYVTSLRLAQAVFTSTVPTVYLATGRDFPDALSAGAAAAKAGGPVVLVNGSANGLDTASFAVLLNKLAPQTIVVTGGTGAISNGVFNDAQVIAPTVVRVGSVDRYYTSMLIAEYAWTRDSGPDAYLASGRTFPDALVGSSIAGKNGAPLVLTDYGCLYAASGALNYLAVPQVTLIGGPTVISDNAAFNGICQIA